MAFNMDDYVDVPERLRRFKTVFPNGYVTAEILRYDENVVVVRAYAHREPGDTDPAIGHAKEIIPGLTPYTKNAELENAETSAWGRALAALNFDDFGKVASTTEVRNRTAERSESKPKSNRKGSSEPAPF